MRWSIIAILLAGCAGAPADKTAAPDKPASVPAPAPDPRSAPPRAEPTPAPKPMTCTDGGAFTGARIAATGVRACFDALCWAYDFEHDTATRVPDAGSDGFEIRPREYGRPPEPEIAPAWTTKGSDELDDGGQPKSWSVCGPSGCETWKPPGLAAGEQYALSVSASGARVAVVRSADLVVMPETGRVEVYDRASKRKLATVASNNRLCAHDAGFAGESAVIQHNDCVNHGGPLSILSPTGKVVLSDVGLYWFDGFDHVDGDRWVFASPHDAHVRIVDVATGAIVADYMLAQGATVRGVGGKVYGFENGRVTRYDVATGKLAEAEPPSCRWQWEKQAIGGLRVGMSGKDVIKALGMPRAKASRDRTSNAWTYKDGLVLVMDGTPGSTEPPRLTAIELAAPSALTTTAGVGIGSTNAQLDAAYGAHALGDGAYGNAGESGGIHVTLDGGKVATIRIAE